MNQSEAMIYRFPAEMAALPALLAQLQALCRQSDPALVARAATAIEELFTNSVSHGLRTDATPAQVGLAVQAQNGSLQVRYEDGFLPFDPFLGLDKTLETLELAVEGRSVGGLGRLIVRGLADQSSYTRDQTVNRIDLLFSPRATMT